MAQNQKIPTPPETGSTGEQTSEDIGGQLTRSDPLGDLPIAKTIEGLASSKSRAMGGEVVSALIAGSTAQIAHELNSVKSELADLRKKYEASANELSEQRENNAVLKERLRMGRSISHLKNLAIFIGTTLLGVAIELHSVGLTHYSVASGVLGCLLLGFGWMSGLGGKEE